MRSKNNLQPLYDLFGTEDLKEIITYIELERRSMLDLHDENTALRIHDRRLRLVFALCVRVFDALDGQMFLPPGVGQKIAKAREQMRVMEKHIADRELVERN